MTELFLCIKVEDLHHRPKLYFLFLDPVLAGKRMGFPACRVNHKIRTSAASFLLDIVVDCREVPNLGYQHMPQPESLGQKFDRNRCSLRKAAIVGPTAHASGPIASPS